MLPSCVLSEIQKYSDIFEERMESLINLMKDLVDGTKKKEVTEWWLSYIETETNQFLCDRGYQMDALPYNYLDVPPRDFEAVRRNLKIIRDIMSVGCEELDTFLEKTTNHIYITLQRHVEDVKFILNLNWEQMSLGDYAVTSQQRVSLQDDLEYLREMKMMDDEIQSTREKGAVVGKRAEMTGVVPIGGLVMARFHILDCELTSVMFRFRQSTDVPSDAMSSSPAAVTNDSEKFYYPETDSSEHDSILLNSARQFLESYSEEKEEDDADVGVAEADTVTPAAVTFSMDSPEEESVTGYPFEDSSAHDPGVPKEWSSFQRLSVRQRSRRNQKKRESAFQGSVRFRQFVLETTPSQTPHKCIEYLLDKKNPTLWTKTPSTNIFQRGTLDVRSESATGSGRTFIAKFRHDGKERQSLRDVTRLEDNSLNSLSLPPPTSSSSVWASSVPPSLSLFSPSPSPSPDTSVPFDESSDDLRSVSSFPQISCDANDSSHSPSLSALSSSSSLSLSSSSIFALSSSVSPPLSRLYNISSPNLKATLSASPPNKPKRVRGNGGVGSQVL